MRVGALAAAIAVGCGPNLRPPTPATLAMTFVISPSGDSSAPVEIRLMLASARDSLMDLRLPSEWAGRHELYRNIIGLSATTPDARLRVMERKDRVQVIATPGTMISVTWRLAPTPPSYAAPDAHNHSDIGRGWAQLVGYDALVLPDVDRSTPVTATFVFAGLSPSAPVATSFGVRRSAGDSVVVARTLLGGLEHAIYAFGVGPSAIRSYATSVNGSALHVLVRGRLAIPDSMLVDGVRRVVAAERHFWGSASGPDYLVSIGVAPRGTLAGTRLTNTFVADLDSTFAMGENVLTLFAHEMMHDWIGGLLHPDPGLRDGALAWFMEGFDEYAAHRALLAGGLISDSSYLRTISAVLVEHNLSSARDSSWDAIVDGFWHDPAMQRQPYLRGELAALRLDASLRRAEPRPQSLDSTLAAMVRAALSRSQPLTEPLIYLDLGRDIGAGRVRSELEPMIRGGPIALPNTALGACATPTMVERARWDPGFDVDSSIRSRTVRGVRQGGPADRAGLHDGQTLVGFSFRRGDAATPMAIRTRVPPDTGTTLHRYDPIGALVQVQQWSLVKGCHPPVAGS
jgi:predicted metalloprotease with PDZ domain